mgnify:CR=1 FL=1
MLNVNIICIGKLKEKYLRDAVSEYEKRLTAFCKLNIIELGEYALPDNPSPADINRGLEKEGEQILSKISNGAYVYAMCIEGKQRSSTELSAEIDRLAVEGNSNITFIIGGSYGLSDAVKQRANMKLSMSEMTFPHQLARVMLLEQIYRSFQISIGGPYHK